MSWKDSDHPQQEMLRWEGRRFQPLVCCAGAGEDVAGWADPAQGWSGQLMQLPRLLWSFFIFISSVLALRCNQDESVSGSNKDMGPAVVISTRIFIVQT